MHNRLVQIVTGLLCCFSIPLMAQPIVVNPAIKTASISPNMWGVFFEDINMGADGGIYAEMIKNRSFEFQKPLMGWKLDNKPFREGAITVQNRQQTNTNNPRFIRVQATDVAGSVLSMTNEGFRGMAVKKDLRYDFSCLYQHADNQTDIRMQLELIDTLGKTLGGAIIQPAVSAGKWSKFTASFTATATNAKAKFRITFTGRGSIDLDMISLFPEDTWKKRPGGMRADMIQLLADMKPGFIRFPGGCIVEGFDLNNRYQWKKTIGPIEERQLIMNRWNVEFAHRPAPDYFQTFGLGFFEYFQLAEDIGAKPLPILNCGMACQFNSAELVPMDQLDPYIQDALDLVEFANGDTNTVWGKKRAAMGHAAPFNLTMIGIGNENWGPQYVERLQAFTKAIRSKYPGIQIIASSGTDPVGERFDFLNQSLRAMQVDFVDEHYYRKPDWFLSNASRYDAYTRNGSKVFAGEYAAHSDSKQTAEKRNNWQAALSEAAFLTGLERNADVVQMASYAPLFAHVEGWQWNPDLIWVNNQQVIGSASYQVQKMYALNKGTHAVAISRNGAVMAGKDSLYASAVVDANTQELLIKIANVSATTQTLPIDIAGVKMQGKMVQQTLLQHPDLMAANSFDQPDNIVPVQTTVLCKGKTFTYEAKPYSFVLLRIALKK